MQPRIAWSVLVVSAAAACASSGVDVAKRFSRTTYCPEARVHVREVPELELEPIEIAPPNVPAWVEPVLPADVANDPERMKLWQEQRVGAFFRWQRARARAEGHVEPALAVQLYEVTGCARAQLYECQPHSCTVVENAMAPSEHLACRGGGAVRAVGGAITCSRGETTVDPYACQAACSSSSCNAACGKGPVCETSCIADEMKCDADCITSAREQCEARGLGLFGLCSGLAAQESPLRREAERAAASATSTRELFAHKDRLDRLTRDHQTCADSCRGATDSRTMVGCLTDCATRAREQCERDVPTTWCEGFRIEERGLRSQLGR